MKILYLFSLFFLFLGVSVSCKKSKPQLPSNKANYSKSEVEMDKVNKFLVEKEDSILQTYVKEQGFDLKKNDAGFYYKISQHSTGNFLKENDVCIVSYKIYLLDGSLVEEVNDAKVIVGKHETLKGIDLGLKLLRKGESGVFIFPWTLAYGILGNRTTIPAYTSLKVELSVAK